MLRDVAAYCKVLIAVLLPLQVLAANTCDVAGRCSCGPDQYQEAILVPSCLGRTCTADFDILKAQSTKVVTLISGMENVLVVLRSDNADMDLKLEDEDNRCLIGALCTPPAGSYAGTEACTVQDEVKECFLLDDMILYFSGDDTDVPIKEEIQALTALTQNLSVTVSTGATGVGSVTLSNAPMTSCPSLLPGCRHCSDYTGCAQGEEYPVCTGCSEVTCVLITTTTSTATKTSMTSTSVTATSWTATDTSVSISTTTITSVTITHSSTTTGTSTISKTGTSTSLTTSATSTSATSTATISTSQTTSSTTVLIITTSLTSTSTSTASATTTSASSTQTVVTTTGTSTATSTIISTTTTSSATETTSTSTTRSSTISFTSTSVSTTRTSTTASTVSTETSTRTSSTSITLTTSTATTFTATTTLTGTITTTTTLTGTSTVTTSTTTLTSITHTLTTTTRSTVTITSTTSMTTSTTTCACCGYCQAPLCSAFEASCQAAFPPADGTVYIDSGTGDQAAVDDNTVAVVALLSTGVVLLLVEALIACVLFRLGWMRPSARSKPFEKEEFRSVVPDTAKESQDLRKAHQSLLTEEALRRTEQLRNATLIQQVASLGEERSALVRAKAKADSLEANFQAQLADSQRTQQELQHQLLETQRDSALHVRQLQEQLAASEQVQGALERELEDMRSRLQDRMQEQKVVPPLDLSSVAQLPKTEVGHGGYSGMTPRDVEQVQLAVAQSLHNEIAHTYLHMQQLLHEKQETPWHPASPRQAPASSYSQDQAASEPTVPPPPPSPPP